MRMYFHYMSRVQNAGTFDTATLRKARGAFFTPREISKFIAEWAIRSPDDLTLEPSCGEASFLLSVGDRLSSLGYKPNKNLSQLVGIEIHDSTAREAANLLTSGGFPCRIQTADFFDVPPNPIYDAVVGN